MPINIVPKQSEEDNERDAREAAVAGPLKAPKKRIVTKEEMKKEGYDNLRDYLNFKQGKVRRKDSTTPKAEPAKVEAEPVKVDAEPVKTKTEDEKKFGTFGARGRNLSPANPSKFKKGGKVESKLMGKEGRGMAKATMQKVASKAVKAHESRMHKMKSGETVSSASKRGDGIAMKGKTRGRMV
jgi:hypothetical protein